MCPQLLFFRVQPGSKFYVSDCHTCMCALSSHHQGNLEEVVETVSQMVNRPYLCTPRHAMAKTASCVNTLCDKYLKSMKRRPSHSDEPSLNQ